MSHISSEEIDHQCTAAVCAATGGRWSTISSATRLAMWLHPDFYECAYCERIFRSDLHRIECETTCCAFLESIDFDD